jgi:DNA-binding CsgD family transcriptional regulator
MKRAVQRRAQKFTKTQVLPVNVAVLDAGGTIVNVNDAWKQFGRRNGLRLPRSGLGLSYLDYCSSESPNAPGFVQDLKDLLAGRLDLLTLIYPCHSPTKKRWFFLSGVPLSLERPDGVALLHTNLTNLLPRARKSRRQTAMPPRRVDVEPAISMDVVGAAIERSIASELALQLGPISSPLDARQAAKRDAAQTIARARLSRSQLQVLGLLARGKTNAEIARMLFRSPHTVKLHVSAILKQLNYKNRTQAALLASRLLDRAPPMDA